MVGTPVRAQTANDQAAPGTAQGILSPMERGMLHDERYQAIPQGDAAR